MFNENLSQNKIIKSKTKPSTDTILYIYSLDEKIATIYAISLVYRNFLPLSFTGRLSQVHDNI